MRKSKEKKNVDAVTSRASKRGNSKERASKKPSSKGTSAPKNKNTAQANAGAGKNVNVIPKETTREGSRNNHRERFPKKFPFWARLKISKERTTLVIDEEDAYNKQKKKMEPGFVHREAIHENEKGDNVKGYEKIEPNPDSTDPKPMYLKGPSKKPQRLFKPHNKNLDMPKHLQERYDKNNHKNGQ